MEREFSLLAIGLSRALLSVLKPPQGAPGDVWASLSGAQREQQPLGRVSGAGRLSVEQKFLPPGLLPKLGPAVAGQG